MFSLGWLATSAVFFQLKLVFGGLSCRMQEPTDKPPSSLTLPLPPLPHARPRSLQSFFGLGQSAEIEIQLADVEKRKKVDVRNEEGKKEKLMLYLDGETVSGKVR